MDTGAHDHTLVASVADLLKLTRVNLRGSTGSMTGGAPLNTYVAVKDITLGGVTAPETQMFVLPDERLPGTDGLLTAGLFSHFDLELDYAAGSMKLFTPCSGRGAYWAHASEPIVLPFTTNADNHIHMNAKLGGKTVDVRLDTGASETAADIRAMSSFDLKIDSPGVRDMGKGRWYRYTFDKLELGALTLPNAEVAFVNGPRNELFVGSAVLRHYHVLISYRDKTLTLTNASDDPGRAAALEAFNKAYDASIHHDADGARSHYSEALAPFYLPPSYRAAAYFGRARANLDQKQCGSAWADLNSAIALDPLIVDARRLVPSPAVQALRAICPK